MLADNPSSPLILVVEDDQGHAELIRRAFDDATDEYRLLFAATLKEARESIQCHLPRLVLTDYRLPDGNGSELVTIAEDDWPVVLMTSHGSEQLAVEALKAGAQDYIVKSAETFSSLSRIVQRTLKAWDMLQERQVIEKAILRAKHEWEQTFDAVPDLIALIDTDHTLIRVNSAMARHFGCSTHELVGRKCYEFMHKTQCAPAACPHILTLQDKKEHTRSGTKILDGCFDLSVSPLFDAEGNITACVHVARDISARMKAEEERLLLEQQFRQAQKLESLGVLSGGIAHDFNNILTIILGHCFLIKDNVTGDTASKQCAEKIEIAAQRAADLCRQMLTYAGRQKPVQKSIDLAVMINEIMNMLRSAIARNVVVELDLGHDVPEIMGDSSQIQQIVMNLAINASEAIGDSTGTIRVSLVRKVVTMEQGETDYEGKPIPCGEYACLQVSDNGCGMDPETCRRIFEPFYTTKFTGRGLGMSAALGIIKGHSGAVQLTSTPGAGTDFMIYIPAAGSQSKVPLLSDSSLKAPGKRTGRILLVDDEENLRTLVAAQLKSLGFSVTTASNGRDALEIHSECGSSIDLVVMDMTMPVMGGIEAYFKLRRQHQSLPIVICSGHGLEDFAKTVAEDTRVGILQKPYTPSQLLGVLENFL